MRPAQPKAEPAIDVTQRWIRVGEYLLKPVDHLCRAALQNGLVNLCFQSLSVLATRAEGSKERRGTRQIAFRLRDSRFGRQRIDVVRCDVKNLIKLSQRIGETTESDIGNRVLRAQVNVARVEPLRFVKVRFAPVPLAAPPFQIGQRLRNPTTIRQERTSLLKVANCGVVIPETGVVIIALRPNGLAKVRLKSERGFGCLPCLFPQGQRWLKSICEVAACLNV